MAGRFFTSIGPPPAHVVDRAALRNIRLAELGFPSYGDYLRSDCWIATKERFRASQLPQECICGDEDVHLHHLTYERVGKERLSDLMPLCRTCHRMVHALEARGDIGLDLEGFVMDEERAAQGRVFLMKLVADRQLEADQARLAHQEEVLAMSFAARLLKASEVATARRREARRPLFMVKKMVARGSHQQATLWLRRLEEAAYDWEGWGDSIPAQQAA